MAAVSLPGVDAVAAVLTDMGLRKDVSKRAAERAVIALMRDKVASGSKFNPYPDVQDSCFQDIVQRGFTLAKQIEARLSSSKSVQDIAASSSQLVIIET
jgi:hypothetical protein